MNIRHARLFVRPFGLPCWLAVALGAGPGAARADSPDLMLPDHTIVADVQYTPDGDTTFAIALDDVGDGYDVTDGTYGGWCVENNGNPTDFEVRLYSTLDPAMPESVAFYQSDSIPVVATGAAVVGDPIPWDELNYLLNHKQGHREDVQAAIWELIWGDASSLDLTAASWAMLDQAGAEGRGYVPGPGDIVAVILYVDGLQQQGFQETVIEVPVPQPSLGAIGDWVWEDIDQDGIQDVAQRSPQTGDEAGVGGVDVSLLSAGADDLCGTGDESLIESTVTDDQGRYRFDRLPAGTYCIRFLPQADWGFTPPDQGADDTLDSDAAPDTGTAGPITLTPGETRLDVDAGLVREPCEPGGPTHFILAYRDADGALSTVQSDTGRTDPLRVDGDALTTGLTGTTTAAYNGQDGLIYLATGEGDDALYTIDPATGDLARIGPLTGGASNLQTMDFAPPPALGGGFVPGALYGISIDGMEGCGPNCLFQIDPATGEATAMASLAANQIRGGSFDPVTGELWVYDPGGKTLSTVTADGTLTQRMRVPDSHQDGRTGVDTVFSLAHGCDGTLYAIDIAYGVLVRFDLQAGQAFWVAEYGTASSTFGSFEGNGLDAMDPELCLCDPETPPPTDDPDGGTEVVIVPADPYVRAVPEEHASPACGTTPSGPTTQAWWPWYLLLIPGFMVRHRRR